MIILKANERNNVDHKSQVFQKLDVRYSLDGCKSTFFVTLVSFVLYNPTYQKYHSGIIYLVYIYLLHDII